MSTRSTPRRHRPHPPQIPPTPSRSGKHRRRQLKAAYGRLGRTVDRAVCGLVGMSDDSLLIEAVFATAPGLRNRRGKAFRLAVKVLRLRRGIPSAGR